MDRRQTVAFLAAFLAGACAERPPGALPAPAPAPQQETPAPQQDAPKANSESEAAPADPYAFLQASDRSEEDRVLDLQRKPVETLEFFGIKSGMKVAELAAGGGYTVELLARMVGPEGKVYGQNSPFILERYAEGPWSERLKKPELTQVVRQDSEFDAPFAAGTTDLDAVVFVLFYHDTVWMKTDRKAMNKAVFDALRPGGIYGIIDHSAKAGAGVSEAQSLHRIEESVVVEEVKAAGFELDGQGEFLRNESDPRDWNAAPSKAGERRGTSDRFVLRFKKPKYAGGTVPSSH